MVSNLPLSHSPPPITTTTPGSTSNSVTGGQRPKLSLHIPDDEDPSQQAEDSGGSATPGTASPEINRAGDRQDSTRRERNSDPENQRHESSTGESYFLPPPSSSTLLPNGRLSGPGLGGFDNNNNSGGTPLSALPSRYAGDMLPSPSTFYPEFYGNLSSAGTSNIRGGFSGIMNGTPVVGPRGEDPAPNTNTNTSFGGGYGSGEKRKAEEISGTNKRARN
jgi:MADS-box transcription factor